MDEATETVDLDESARLSEYRIVMRRFRVLAEISVPGSAGMCGAPAQSTGCAEAT